MKEQDIIYAAVTELEAVLPAGVTVRTRGGDAAGSPPLCLVGWDSTRLPTAIGANPLAATTTDPSTGTETGREFHRVHRMELDITIREYDEGVRDTYLSDIADAFLPYEYDSDAFHPDTAEWEVGDARPRSVPVVEPDWYEGGLTIRFTYTSRTTQTADSLDNIVDGGNGGVYSDDTL